VPLHPDYPIATNRLRLRPLRADDLQALLDYHSLPHVHRFLPMGTMGEAVIAERIATGPWSRTTLEEEGDSMVLGVELAESGTIVGDVMLAWISSRNRLGEIGYVLNPNYAGRGLATEAMRQVMRLAFNDMGLHRVIARVDSENGPSLALAARLGMRREAHLVKSWWRDDEWVDEIHLAILRSEWNALQPDRPA
jgi:RimJ/RimL family protein N-acetyltransferase